MTTQSTVEIGAAYIRVSTNDQTELSPDAQLRVILESAKADGYVIPKEFVYIEKKGVSGRRADNRQEFQRMVATAKTQPCPFKRLYLWKFSRFARNQDESVFYKSVLRKKCGVEIKSVSEPIADGMFGRLIESIIEWFDEYYSFNLSGEVMRGMTEKALREGYQCSPSLGYAAVGEGKPFIIVEKEYVIVDFIHQSFHKGKDMTAIAREANDMGFRTKRGNRFDRRGIYRILVNEFYNGIVVWNGIKFQGAHETRPSITDIFESNQQRIKEEYRPKSRRETSSCQHWLSGILKCSVCGASLSYNRSNDQKKRPDFFQCWKYGKGVHRESCSVSVKKAEEAVLTSLRQVMADQSVQYEYIRKPDQKVISEESRLSEALEKVAMKEMRVKDAYESGIDSLEEYKANKLRLQDERTHILDELEQLKETPDEPEGPDMQEILKRITTVYDLLMDPDIDNVTKGNAVRRIIKKIVFDRQMNEFHFYYYA